MLCQCIKCNNSYSILAFLISWIKAGCHTEGTHKSGKGSEPRGQKERNIFWLRHRVSWPTGTSLPTARNRHNVRWTPRPGWRGQSRKQKVRHRRFSGHCHYTPQKWSPKSEEESTTPLLNQRTNSIIHVFIRSFFSRMACTITFSVMKHFVLYLSTSLNF